MTSIASPFIGQIRDCKLSMRKLRKKIYKHCITKPKSRKQKDSTDEIIQIFQKRNIPSFVTQSLKKRRSFDMSSIKNIVINSTLPLEDIRNKVSRQENQIDALYFDHKQRMEEEKRKLAENRPPRIPSMFFNQSNIYSSTNEDDLLGSLEEEEISISSMEDPEQRQSEPECNFYTNFEEVSKEPILTDNYLHLNQSSFNEDLGFLNF